MPNWCENRITFETAEDLEKAKSLLQGRNHNGEESELTFNVVVPMPENIFRGDLGRAERERYGNLNWFDWCNEHWGTKWDACDPSYDKTAVWFSTAWCPPEAWLEAFAKALGELGITARIDCWTEGCGDIVNACDAWTMADGELTYTEVDEAFADDYAQMYADEDEDE